MTTNQHNQNQKPKKTGKIIALVLAIIFITGTISGLFLFKKYQDKKIAKDYINQEAENFSEIVELVNDLSTEEVSGSGFEIGGRRSSLDKEEEMMAKELVNANKALSKIKEAKKENRKRESNDYIFELTEEVENFYEIAEDQVSEYVIFSKYRSDFTSVFARYEKEMEKMFQVSSGAVADEGDVVNILEDVGKTFSSLGVQISEVVPPEDLEDFHKNFSNLLIEAGKAFSEYSEAIRKEDLKEIAKAKDTLDEVLGEKVMMEDFSVIEYYVEEMGEDFESLQEEAEMVEEELIIKATELGVNISNVRIENW